MVVNMDGGPRAVDITADAPIVVKDAETFYKNPSYYHMRLFSKAEKKISKIFTDAWKFCIAHLSKFVNNGDTILPVQLTGVNSYKIQYFAVKEPGADRCKKVVLLNQSDDALNMQLYVQEDGTVAKFDMPARSIISVKQCPPM